MSKSIIEILIGGKIISLESLDYEKKLRIVLWYKYKAFLPSYENFLKTRYVKFTDKEIDRFCGEMMEIGLSFLGMSNIIDDDKEIDLAEKGQLSIKYKFSEIEEYYIEKYGKINEVN